VALALTALAAALLLRGLRATLILRMLASCGVLESAGGSGTLKNCGLSALGLRGDTARMASAEFTASVLSAVRALGNVGVALVTGVAARAER
jgi:hypothetical protein